MVRTGEIEHGRLIAGQEESVWHWGTPAGRLRVDRRAKLIADAAGLTTGVRALELGCGTGIFTRRFAATGASIVAIDVSPELLDRAVAKIIEYQAVGEQVSPFDGLCQINSITVGDQDVGFGQRGS